MSTIYTGRLVLRPFHQGDAEAMFRNWTYDERVARYCRWYPHIDIDSTYELLELYLSEYTDTFDYRWAITIADHDEPIGCIDVVGFADEGRTPEIGYVLGNSYWGKGIMTEALRAVIGKLFDDGYERVIACHRIENPASGRVMENAGMHFIGESKVNMKFGSARLCTVKNYEICKEHYNEQDMHC